ncbi:MAG: hypothetical protein ACRC8A_02260 [Microcoleaceae cyanobacterium]
MIANNIKLLVQIIYLSQLIINASLAWTLLRNFDRSLYRLLGIFFILEAFLDIWPVYLLAKSPTVPSGFTIVYLLVGAIAESFIAGFVFITVTREAKVVNRLASTKLNKWNLR